MTDDEAAFGKQLHIDALRWVQEGKPHTLLYKDQKLDQAKQWACQNIIGQVDWDYIEAGIVEENNWIIDHLAELSRGSRIALNNIVGYSSLLMGEHKESQPSLLEDLKSINYSGYQLLKLINCFIDLVKIQSGRMEFKSEYIDLDEVIDYSIARIQSDTAYEGIKIEKHPEPDLPKPYGDPTRVRQVMEAAMYALMVFAKGDIINIRARHAEPHVQIDLIKNGIGEYFKRHIDTSLSMQVAIHLVRLQKGHMWFESDKSDRTTISFTLPIVLPKDIPKTSSANDLISGETAQLRNEHEKTTDHETSNP